MGDSRSTESLAGIPNILAGLRSGGASGGDSFPGAAAGPTFTMQPAMPGQLEAVASQLGLAYGEKPKGLLSHMDTLYQPMVLPDYAPNRQGAGANPKPASAPAPKPVDALEDWYNNFFNNYMRGGR